MKKKCKNCWFLHLLPWTFEEIIFLSNLFVWMEWRTHSTVLCTLQQQLKMEKKTLCGVPSLHKTFENIRNKNKNRLLAWERKKNTFYSVFEKIWFSAWLISFHTDDWFVTEKITISYWSFKIFHLFPLIRNFCRVQRSFENYCMFWYLLRV